MAADPKDFMEPEVEVRRSRRRSRRHRSGSVQRGRIVLAGMFLVLCAWDIWIYSTTADYARQKVLSILLPSGIIMSSLLVGVACRQSWARYLLIALIFLRVALSLIVLPVFIDEFKSSSDLLIRMLSGPIIDAGIAWALISLPDVRRLVSRNYE